MSISDHGRSRLNWVWRWANGFLRSERPPIHILEGENVCIHRTNPAHSGLWFASMQSALTSSEVVRSALNTTGRGSPRLELRDLAIVLEFSATRLSGPGP